jgi:hypothetical protein
VRRLEALLATNEVGVNAFEEALRRAPTRNSVALFRFIIVASAGCDIGYTVE